MLPVIYHVDVEDHFRLRRLLYSLDGLFGGCLIGEGEEIGRHDTARGVLLVAEEILDLLGLLLRHQAQDLLGQLLRQFADEIGPIVGGHRLEDFRYAMLVHSLQELGAAGLVDLAQYLRRCFGVLDEIEDNPLFPLVEVVEEVGDIGGMGLGDDPFQVSRGLPTDEPPRRFQEEL